MHIPENYLSPATCSVMIAAMVPVWTHAVKKVNKEPEVIEEKKEDNILPVVGGTTGHAVGGTLIALLFGPEASCLAVSIALLIQALLFGDGGVLAFGANCFNMAFVLPFAGYAIYKLITKNKKDGAIKYIAAALSSYIALNLAALCAAIEFGIQPLLFKDAAGHAIYCPYDLSISIPAMLIPHLAVAGVVEALFTVAIFAFVKKTSPDLVFENMIAEDEKEIKKHIPLFALVAVLIAATPLGLLATGTAWGEWGSDEIAEIFTNGKELGYTPSGLLKGWSLETIMPDYTLKGVNEVAAYILSAVIGVALLIIIFKLLSIPMKGRKKDASNVA